jgi:acetyl esterase/lipase
MAGLVSSPPGIAENDGGVSRPRRGPALITASAATVGAAATYLAALPAQLDASAGYAILFVVLGLSQIGLAVAVLARPSRRWALGAAAAAAAVVLLWLAGRSGWLPDPDPWQPVDDVIGFVGALVSLLEGIAAALLVGVAVVGHRPRRTPAPRLLALVAVPLAVVVLAGTVLDVVTASAQFTGVGSAGDPMAPADLVAGQRGTVTYCRPHGVSLAMDIYPPSAGARRAGPAPAVLYVHGGGLIFGDRRTTGLGAALANHDGALFSGVRQGLNERGIVVASIDYRLPPGTAWPAQIEDAKCAVRFLRAHAGDLHIDPARIGAWGSSAGGTLASLLGLAGTDAGFDVGQYTEQSSAVQAVVDMFGPSDLTDVHDSSPVMRTAARIGLGDSTPVRRAVSPVTYVRPGAPPFLILHGTADQDVPLRHSVRLAGLLREAHVPATLVRVDGAEHGLDNPRQRPAARSLTATVVAFLAETLG